MVLRAGRIRRQSAISRIDDSKISRIYLIGPTLQCDGVVATAC
jgi:hypothetical protein